MRSPPVHSRTAAADVTSTLLTSGARLWHCLARLYTLYYRYRWIFYAVGMAQEIQIPMTYVLIADDDAGIRHVIREILEEDNYRVEEAADGAGALAHIRGSGHPLVVLLDMLLPQMSGGEILRAVADDASLAGRHVFVLLTAGSQRLLSDIGDVLTRLDVPVVEKPFDMDQLLAEVARAAAKLPAGH